MSRGSDQRQVQDKCPQFPLNINKDLRCHAQPDTITLLPIETAITYIHNPPPPLTNHCKKICKE